MKKLVLVLFTISLFAQNPPTQVSGLYDATAFNYGFGHTTGLSILSGTTQTGVGRITTNSGRIVLSDGTFVYSPVSTNTPIVVGNPLNAETVTPSAVSCTATTCTITATFANVHGVGEPISSASFGLYEAINYVHGIGGSVVVNGAWVSSGGTGGILSGAPTFSNVKTLDNRTGLVLSGGGANLGMNQLVYTKSGAYTFLTSDCGSHFNLLGTASSYSFPLPSPSAVAAGCRIEIENYNPTSAPSTSFVQVTGNIAGTASQIVTVAIGRTVAFVSDGATTWNLEYQAEGIESCAASSALVSGVYTVSLADAYKFVGGFCNGSSQPTSYVLPDVDNAAANGIPFFPVKGLWFDFVNSTNGIQTISGPSSGFGDFFTYTIPGQAQTFNSSSSYSLAPGATVRVILGGMTGTATPQAHWQVIGQTAQQTSFAPLAVSLAAGSGVTSVTCTSATCDVNGGRISIVGGTATTGVIATVSYTALTTAPRVCQVTMNGGTTFLGLGYGTPTTTSFTITAAVSVLGITFEADYTCRP